MTGAHIVVAGGGLAGATVVRELRARGHTGPITLVSDETHAPYDRPPLSKQLLAGTFTPEQTQILGPDTAAELGVKLLLGVAVTALDDAGRRLELADGSRLDYDELVIATGSRARRLPSIPDLPGVHYLRTLDDATALAEALRQSRRLVVVGAGFIGLEVAAVARDRGIDVTVVETAACPLTRVLGPTAGRLIADLHESHGVRLRCSRGIADVRGSSRVEDVVLTDGEVIPADLVLVGVGAVPNTEWLAGSRVQVDDGVVCDETGRSSVSGVWAAGDVSRWRNALTGAQVRVEQWQSAVEQATVVADRLTGGDRVWDSVPYFWSDQYDKKLQFCGSPGALTATRDTARGPVVCFGDGPADDADTARLVGVLTLSNPRALAHGRRLVAAGTSWAKAQEWLATL